MVNTDISVSAPVSDPDYGDTLSAIWDWGDGTNSTGNITEGTANGIHSYQTPGVYTVNLAVTDEAGASQNSTYEYVVIYDPNGGFVTGGGWFTSPAGAYTSDPNLSGKATFGFVSRYEHGATTPTGNTQFQFHTADLSFRSASYEWLVIAGAKAQYKGSGTINGTGDYFFMISAIDGQLKNKGEEDTFRIRIWDKSTESVIYDNMLDSSEDLDPTTSLGGGSIVIHK